MNVWPSLKHAVRNKICFHKIVLFTFEDNQQGQKLYQKSGYRTVGVMEKQGIMGGDYKDVMIMEKILS